MRNGECKRRVILCERSLKHGLTLLAHDSRDRSLLLLGLGSVPLAMPKCPNKGCKFRCKEDRGLAPHMRECQYKPQRWIKVTKPNSEASGSTQPPKKRVRISGHEEPEPEDLNLPGVRSLAVILITFSHFMNTRWTKT
jgi:hypothetical protein